jgi:hypothetical protein
MLWMDTTQLIISSEYRKPGNVSNPLWSPWVSRFFFREIVCDVFLFKISNPGCLLFMCLCVYVLCLHTASWHRDFSTCLSTYCSVVGHWCKWCVGRIKVDWPWSWLAWHSKCTMKNTKGFQVLIANIFCYNFTIDVGSKDDFTILPRTQWCQIVWMTFLIYPWCTSAMIIGCWNDTWN